MVVDPKSTNYQIAGKVLCLFFKEIIPIDWNLPKPFFCFHGIIPFE
jgi:hypothetical protein